MNRNYFLKKKIINIFKRSVLLLLKAMAGLYKLFFAKRTILFVSNHKIRTIHLGLISQTVLLTFIVYAGSIFTQSLKSDKIIYAKSQEIDRLESVNSFFQEEFSHVNEKMQKVNEYLISLTGNKKQISSTQQEFKKPKSLKSEDLSKFDKTTLESLKNATLALNKTQAIARGRIEDIENSISDAGLNLRRMPSNNLTIRKTSGLLAKEVSLNKIEDLKRAQGGPLLTDEISNLDTSDSQPNAEGLEKHLEKMQFASEFDRLFLLEKLVSVMPLSRPMKNYYISSGFGSRSDPINHRKWLHKGLDFVGPLFEKIMSPASGKVIVASRYGDYGKAIIIDHGFGITTRYGHLSSIKVKKGQTVQKGQIIAAQGSTGRSTGQHLHYEVRYKGKPLNPKKFLKAGDFLLRNNKTT